MLVEATFSLKIKISDFYVSPNLSESDVQDLLQKEGEKRLRHYLSGYLLDPEKKVIEKQLSNIIKK